MQAKKNLVQQKIYFLVNQQSYSEAYDVINKHKESALGDNKNREAFIL